MDPVAITGWVVLVALTGATVTFLGRIGRGGAPITLVAAATLAFGTGLITVGLAVGHILGVLTVELGQHASPVRFPRLRVAAARSHTRRPWGRALQRPQRVWRAGNVRHGAGQWGLPWRSSL